MSLSRFALTMLLAGAALLALFAPVTEGGDFPEYNLQTVAFATHGTPDLRLADIATVKRLLPQQQAAYALLEQDMLAGKQDVYPAFTRGHGGKVYPVHFFAYPMLAAVPFKLLQWSGLPPFKCYQVLNLCLVFVLGLALFRLYGSGWKAWSGLLLFAGCGGVLYWPWPSPECMSAAALLAGLLFFATGAPVRGGLLGGLAALQNPTILFFFGFAPLFKLIIGYQPALGWMANLRRQLSRRALLGLALGVALTALPPLFNLYQYGVPNIIVKKFSNAGFISLTRLTSFFFDLNQGMLLAVPGVLLALLALLCLLRGRERRRTALLLAAALLFILALTVPALAVLNWNSGAVGIMRYVAWALTPLLFVLLWRLSLLQRWPVLPLGAAAVLQGVAMAHALSYSYIQFSPLAELVLKHAPAHYHPEPEIFAERSANNDDYLDPQKIYVYPRQGAVVKRLYDATLPGMEARLCGPGRMPAPDSRTTDTVRGWRYLDGELRCVNDDLRPIRLQLADMRQATMLRLVDGWSDAGAGGGIWDGAWSTADSSRLVVTPPAHRAVRHITLRGHYADGNARTRVSVNGVDLGWAALDGGQPLTLPAAISGTLAIELRHEAPRTAGNGDPRRFAYFLQAVELQ